MIWRFFNGRHWHGDEVVLDNGHHRIVGYSCHACWLEDAHDGYTD